MRLQAHAAILESIVPQLEAEGFEVYTRPSPSLLPPFLQTDAPDAIALRDDRKLAVEVVHKGASSERRLDRLRAALVDHRDWELRVYWISPTSAPEAIEPVSRRDIERAIAAVDELVAKNLLTPALLMAWSALEALGRIVLPQQFSRAQTPQRLVQVLAAEGFVTPREADRLRQLAAAHQRIIHGGLRARVVIKDIVGITAVLETLLGFVAPA